MTANIKTGTWLTKDELYAQQGWTVQNKDSDVGPHMSTHNLSQVVPESVEKANRTH
jgi:hypothetical protein